MPLQNFANRYKGDGFPVACAQTNDFHCCRNWPVDSRVSTRLKRPLLPWTMWKKVLAITYLVKLRRNFIWSVQRREQRHSARGKVSAFNLVSTHEYIRIHDTEKEIIDMHVPFQRDPQEAYLRINNNPYSPFRNCKGGLRFPSAASEAWIIRE